MEWYSSVGRRIPLNDDKSVMPLFQRADADPLGIRSITDRAVVPASDVALVPLRSAQPSSKSKRLPRFPGLATSARVTTGDADSDAGDDGLLHCGCLGCSRTFISRLALDNHRRQTGHFDFMREGDAGSSKLKGTKGQLEAKRAARRSALAHAAERSRRREEARLRRAMQRGLDRPVTSCPVGPRGHKPGTQKPRKPHKAVKRRPSTTQASGRQPICESTPSSQQQLLTQQNIDPGLHEPSVSDLPRPLTAEQRSRGVEKRIREQVQAGPVHDSRKLEKYITKRDEGIVVTRLTETEDSANADAKLEVVEHRLSQGLVPSEARVEGREYAAAAAAADGDTHKLVAAANSMTHQIGLGRSHASVNMFAFFPSAADGTLPTESWMAATPRGTDAEVYGTGLAPGAPLEWKPPRVALFHGPEHRESSEPDARLRTHGVHGKGAELVDGSLPLLRPGLPSRGAQEAAIAAGLSGSGSNAVAAAPHEVAALPPQTMRDEVDAEVVSGGPVGQTVYRNESVGVVIDHGLAAHGTELPPEAQAEQPPRIGDDVLAPTPPLSLGRAQLQKQERRVTLAKRAKENQLRHSAAADAFAARMSPMAVANVRQQLALAMQEILAHRFNSFAGLAAEMVDQHGGIATSVLEQELQLGAITDLWASNEKDGGITLAGFICEAVEASRQMEADMAEMPDENSDSEGDGATTDAMVSSSSASTSTGKAALAVDAAWRRQDKLLAKRKAREEAKAKAKAKAVARAEHEKRKQDRRAAAAAAVAAGRGVPPLPRTCDSGAASMLWLFARIPRLRVAMLASSSAGGMASSQDPAAEERQRARARACGVPLRRPGGTKTGAPKGVAVLPPVPGRSWHADAVSMILHLLRRYAWRRVEAYSAWQRDQKAQADAKAASTLTPSELQVASQVAHPRVNPYAAAVNARPRPISDTSSENGDVSDDVSAKAAFKQEISRLKSELQARMSDTPFWDEELAARNSATAAQVASGAAAAAVEFAERAQACTARAAARHAARAALDAANLATASYTAASTAAEACRRMGISILCALLSTLWNLALGSHDGQPQTFAQFTRTEAQRVLIEHHVVEVLVALLQPLPPPDERPEGVRADVWRLSRPHPDDWISSDERVCELAVGVLAMLADTGPSDEPGGSGGRNAVVAAGGAAAALRTAQRFKSWHIRASVLELLFSLVVEAEGKTAVQALDIDPPKAKQTRRARRSSSTCKTGRTGAVSAVFALEKEALACWRSEQPGRSNAQPEPRLFRPR
eukprot:g291.t1